MLQNLDPSRGVFWHGAPKGSVAAQRVRGFCAICFVGEGFGGLGVGAGGLGLGLGPLAPVAGLARAGLAEVAGVLAGFAALPDLAGALEALAALAGALEALAALAGALEALAALADLVAEGGGMDRTAQAWEILL
jgi:hypothetical protein